MSDSSKIDDARMRLIETGGRTSQDLGLGRIVGQILIYLYLQPAACPLDKLEQDLGLSKASVSIAARQLEQLGLITRVWVKGERKKFYRSAENLGKALQQGLLSQLQQKIDDFGEQLGSAMQILEEIEDEGNPDVEFLKKRIERSDVLRKRVQMVIGNPVVKLLAGNK
jgi:DNA-binding transcriptional regulator GbsR (MarR family)